MTKSDPPPGEEPKKKSLRLFLRSKPAAEVETAVGHIYLYPLGVRAMADFGNLEPADALTQVRNFLTSIASLTLESDAAPERISLDPEIAKGLSDDEIEHLAEAYVQSSEWQTVRDGSEERQPVVQEAGEAASAYLIRLVKEEVEHHHQSARRLHDKMLGSTQSLFDHVWKSTSALGSTLSAYEDLNKPAQPAPFEIQPIRTDRFEALNDLMARQARERAEERAEELEFTRLTGQMTAESAKTLKDLAEAATILMEQLDERDRQADKSTRTQITIAVWSVGITAVLAFLALIVSGFAYLQDRDNSISGDQRQAKLLTAIEQGNQQRSAVELENQALQEQAKSLDARIADLEAAQRAAAQTSKATSSPRGATSSGSALPPP